jgi:hypothetical protein
MPFFRGLHLKSLLFFSHEVTHDSYKKGFWPPGAKLTVNLGLTLLLLLAEK